jgi:putative membrane protein
MSPPLGLYNHLMSAMGPILLGVSTLMLLRESGKAGGPRRIGGWRATGAATGVFLCSGALGQLALFENGLVSPLFIGLFGVPTILMSLPGGDKRGMLEGQMVGSGSLRLPLGPVLRGCMAGSLVGWFPGISSAQATIVAMAGDVDREDDVEGARRFIAGVSAVNTANAVFTLVALATLLRVRSGATAAVGDLMAWEAPPWTHGPLPGLDVTGLLLAAALGGLVAAPVTLLLGRQMQRALPYLSARWFLLGVLTTLVAVTHVTWGPVGTLVLVFASALGLVPPAIGLMRVHLMGAVTLPLALGLLL